MTSSANIAYRIIIADSTSLLVSFVALLLRLGCRRLKRATLLTDDYLVISAFIFTIAIGVLSFLLIGVGLGTHLETLDSKQVDTFRQLSYAIRFLYGPAVTFAKLSILFLYRRILPIKQIFLATSIVSGVLITWCAAVICLDLLNCLPIAKAWDPTISGHCIDSSNYTYILQIPSIIIDAAIIAIPLKVVWDCALQLPQKITASMIFLVGFITLAGDIGKFVVMSTASHGPDVTFNEIGTLMWTNIEPALAIVAACIPVMKPLVQSQCLGPRRDSEVESSIRIDIEGAPSPRPLLSQSTQPSSIYHQPKLPPKIQLAIPLTYSPDAPRYDTRGSSRSASFMDI